MSPADAATLTFFQDAAEVTTLDQLTASFRGCVAAHGFQRAAYVRLATPGQPIQPKVLLEWGATDWSERYTAERAYRVDPTIQEIFSAIAPFSWDEIKGRTNTREAAAIFEDLQSSGAVNGLVVPIHGPLGEVSAVALASESETEFPTQVRQRMHVSASLFAARALTLMEREAEPPAPGLTRRETQCVYWIAEGKSDWEIGRILEISEETVAWHVQNAKRKLGVARRVQLPNAAWRRGVLLDESSD